MGNLGLTYFLVCEWRGWRGFHHHAILNIAAYGFLVSERLLTIGNHGDFKKSFIARQIPALPADYIPRGRPARSAACVRFDCHDSLSTQLPFDHPSRTVSLLRPSKRKSALVTQ